MTDRRPKKPRGVFELMTHKTRAPIDPQAILRSLKEDAPRGDITSASTIPEGAQVKASLVAKQDLVAAGMEVFAQVFRLANPGIRVRVKLRDGVHVRKGEIMAVVCGPARSIMQAERVALNYLIRMCSIATLTAKYVEAAGEHGARILDTRKTTPGLRDLEKYSVLCGGGQNHRRDLSFMVLIKENHIAVAGGVAQAVAGAREKVGKSGFIECEVTSLEELAQAIESGASMALLDNMTPAMMTRAVKLARRRIWLEASGNMTIKRAVQAAKAGVDFISVGALTHSAPAVDLSLLVNFA